MATKAKEAKAKEEVASDNQSFTICCPDCKCDHIIPIFQLMFVKSFAGNKIQSAWPSRSGSNDTAVVGCPSCGIVFKIGPDGSITKTGNSWK